MDVSNIRISCINNMRKRLLINYHSPSIQLHSYSWMISSFNYSQGVFTRSHKI